MSVNVCHMSVKCLSNARALNYTCFVNVSMVKRWDLLQHVSFISEKKRKEKRREEKKRKEKRRKEKKRKEKKRKEKKRKEKKRKEKKRKEKKRLRLSASI